MRERTTDFSLASSVMDYPATQTEPIMSEPEPRTIINFYTTTGEYGCFSNFSRHPIHLKGRRWPTSEHYFQAQK